jgi:ABC-type multidrug transport system ATPase subunit
LCTAHIDETVKLELRNVSKLFGAVRALERASFEVEPGQIVAVVGANGAGKTTLLRCLAGVAAPDEGLILYDDESFVRGRLDLRQRLAFLPDFPFLFLKMNPLEHLGMVLRVYGADGAAQTERALGLLRDFDLLPLVRRPMQLLSRGQIYKTALVAVLAADPELWLLDEPFASGMDPHGIDALKRHAREAAARGRTIVYSTQILDIAERFADRICILHRAEVRSFGTLAELQAQTHDTARSLEEIFRQLRSETP